jgi:hypothetical protein
VGDLVEFPEKEKSNTPASDDAIAEAWPEFVEAVRGRLDKGRKAYGDLSFYRPVPHTLAEIEEELLDVLGWSFVLWYRLRRMATVLPKSTLWLERLAKQDAIKEEVMEHEP